ncbi:hypothetical protein GOODEAATRI_002735 [Goodea atripinnis]|uniref:Uncharacterized protein n=1 Tax=Goodea atripinnis TaxID=208336 RepID=A0ABV0NR80_9TELE
MLSLRLPLMELSIHLNLYLKEIGQLRSSFKQAFTKKKSPKSASSHSDIEEMMDSSLPSSPKLPHNGTSAPGHILRNTQSNTLLSECLDSEAETVMQLRSELREKEMKLTDIRLEALSSAHQLDQLREAMNRMQEYITHVDPVSQLGLSTDSVQGYNIREIHRPSSSSTASTPELLPCGYLVGDNSINIQLKGLAQQCSSVSGEDSPLVVILDNLHHVSSLGEIFNGLFNCNYQHRWILCANHMEPVKGFLGRYLRRKLIEMEISSRTRNAELVKIMDWVPRVWHHLNQFLETHSSSDVTIGKILCL